MRKLNLGSGRDIRSAEDGWVNMDGYYAPPGVVKHDFLRTPWPFPDNHFGLIYASHVMEHIPLVFRERDGVMRDMLFDVMEEAHRVLKPGGLFHIRVPWGGSREGMCNPQHYRQWRPEWFRYFDPDHGENYYTTARFRVQMCHRGSLGWRGDKYLRFGRSEATATGLTGHLAIRLPFLRPLLSNRRELEAKIVAVKEEAAASDGAGAESLARADAAALR